MFCLGLLLAFSLSAQAQSVAYSFDQLNRLTQVNYGNGSTIGFTYDGAGNRLSQIIAAAPNPNTIYVSGELVGSVNWTRPSLYVVQSTVTIPSGSTLQIHPGTIIKFASGQGLSVQGTLTSVGTLTEPIVFTSAKDDSSGGDTNGDGTATSPAPGDWNQILLSDGSMLDHTLVRFGASNFNASAIQTTNSPIANSTVERSYGGGIAVYGNAMVQRNLIRHNGRGIDIHAGSPTIRSNRIQGNTSGVTNNNASATVDCQTNWWGHASGPSGVGSGTGDAVSAFVSFDPWIGKPDTVSCSTPNVPYSFPVSDVSIKFETLPVGGGTITMNRHWESPPSSFSPPPEGSSYIEVWLDIASDLPNSEFTAECVVGVSGIEGFTTLSGAAYYNPTSNQWEPIGGIYNPSAQTFTFSTNHFSAFGFLNTDSPVPVTLTSFTGQPLPGGAGVSLQWTTISEVNNFGFFVQRRADSDSSFRDLPGSFVAGHGTTNIPQEYRYTDSVRVTGTYDYRLRQVDLDGKVHYPQPIRIDFKKQTPIIAMPTEFSLSQNYPNPFNPSTVIRYGLPVNARVTLTVYNVLGQTVVILAAGEKEAGYHELRFDASNLSSGVYFYRLRAGDFVQTRKLLLLQ